MTDASEGLQLSPFVYIYRIRANVVCLYHSLLLKKVYLSNNEYLQLLKDIKEGRSSAMISALEAQKLVVADEYSEKKKLEDIAKKLSIKKPNPALSYIMLNDTCNFRCKYCYIENALKIANKQMDREMADIVVEIIKNNAVGKGYRVIFYGGEPTLDLDVMKYIVAKLQEKGKGWFTHA